MNSQRSVGPGGRTQRATRVREKRPSGLKKLFGTITMLVLLVLAVLYLPIFKVGGFEVVGNNKVEASAIISASGIELGQNLFEVNFGKAKKNIKKIAYIAEADMKITWQGNIRILVKENILFSAVQYAGGYIGISQDGKVLEVTADKPEQVPVIEGVSVNNFTEGEVIGIDESEKFDIMIVCQRAIVQTDLGKVVSAIYLEDIYNIKFKIGGKLTVLCGNKDNFSYKLSMLSQVMDKIENGVKGSIDLSVPGKAIYNLE